MEPAPQRLQVRHDVGPRRFERVRAGVGQVDMGAGAVGLGAQHAFESTPRAKDRIAVERVEILLAVSQGAIRHEWHVGRDISFVAVRPLDPDGEPVPAIGDRFDIPCAAAAAEPLPQPRDGLVDAVIGDGCAVPSGVSERLLRDDFPHVQDQFQQDFELGIRQRDARRAVKQARSLRIELERAEAVDAAAVGHRERDDYAETPVCRTSFCRDSSLWDGCTSREPPRRKVARTETACQAAGTKSKPSNEIRCNPKKSGMTNEPFGTAAKIKNHPRENAYEAKKSKIRSQTTEITAKNLKSAQTVR